MRLKTCGGREFYVEREFQGVFLTPVIENLLDKARTGWDDYNEVYHCTELIQKVRRDAAMRMDFHVMRQNGRYTGLMLMTGGVLDTALFFKQLPAIAEPPDKILSLNYFHIAPAGRGCGQSWLTKIVLPYYGEQGYRAVYVKSSHPRAFPLYRRLGEEVGAYESQSDNRLFKRAGKIFKIRLQRAAGK